MEVVVVIEAMASLSTIFGSGVRGGAVCVLLEGEGVMSQMKPIESRDRARVAQLLDAAAQEEALIEQLEKTTRALWRACEAKQALAQPPKEAHELVWEVRECGPKPG